MANRKPFDWSKSYVVGACGTVRNIKTKKTLKPYKMKKGHMQVSLSISGKVKKMLVHRMVADVFVENKKDKPCVNHIDCDPGNNSYDNLEWCTDYENKQHAKKHSLFQQADDRYNARFDDCQILTIHTCNQSHSSLARHYGVSQSVITRIKNGATYKRYAEILCKRR